MADNSQLVRAQQHLDDGRLARAAKLFAAVLAPSDGRSNAIERGASLVGLGRIALIRGDVSRAGLYGGEALRHDPTSVPARILMAEVAAHNGADAPAAAWRREAGLDPVTFDWRFRVRALRQRPNR